MRIIYETGDQVKTEVSIMRRNVTKIAAVMALAAIVAGSSSNTAFAHHGSSHRAVVQTPAPVCYEDGSCDVDGVCSLGADCDGTAHHIQTYHYSRNAHHSGHHY